MPGYIVDLSEGDDGDEEEEEKDSADDEDAKTRTNKENNSDDVSGYFCQPVQQSKTIEEVVLPPVAAVLATPEVAV
jgi:hypothetical protein